MSEYGVPETPAQLFSALQTRAEALGLLHMGVAEATHLDEEAQHLRAFLAAGHHGQMDWLERTEKVRIDPRDSGMLEGATRVIVFATPYARSPERVGPAPGRIARYARGRDYHKMIRKKLAVIAQKIEDFAELNLNQRAFVDSAPVLERALAEKAEIGRAHV